MTYPKALTLTTAAALVFAVAGDAASGGVPSTAARSVVVTCDAEVAQTQNQTPDHAQYQALCEAVAHAVGALGENLVITGPGEDAQPEGVPLRIAVEPQASSRHHLSARLSWQSASGQRGEGPVFDVTSMDAPLNASAIEGLAALLVERSNLPL